MTRFAIDALTLLELAARPGPVAGPLVAPSIIRTQALELLLQAVRRGELTKAEALRRHEDFTEIKVRLLSDRVTRRVAWNLAHDHDWDTLAGAEYLAVTRLQADALVALDPDLAAQAQGIVPLATLADLRDV